jgi:uncharacterized membrane protein
MTSTIRVDSFPRWTLSSQKCLAQKASVSAFGLSVVIGAFTGLGLIALLPIAQGPRFIQVRGDGVVAIQTRDLRPGSVRFYSYRDRAGAELRFLLARDSDGALEAAMDACQRCYTYHKGYVTSDGYLVCKLCGNRYKLAAMSKGLASCVPVKLSLKTDGHTAKIDSAELEHNRRLF